MARPPIPDSQKRLNVGLRLHPVLLEQLDEVVAFFQELHQAKPLLSLNYPESRTDVIEFFLREGVRDVIQHVLAWDRIQSPREQPGDLATMSTSLFWNTLLTEVRGGRPTTPASWRELEWPPRAKRVKKPASSKIPGPAGITSPPARKPRKRHQS